MTTGITPSRFGAGALAGPAAIRQLAERVAAARTWRAGARWLPGPASAGRFDGIDAVPHGPDRHPAAGKSRPIKSEPATGVRAKGQMRARCL